MSEKAKELVTYIEQAEERFNEIAPAHMKYESEKGFAVQLLNNNSYLKQAAFSNPISLQQSVVNVAAIGLTLNPAERLAYLIPRNMKIKDANGREKWETRVFLEPSYMGLIRLATDSGSIEWIQAEVVHANDDFVDNGAGNRPEHKYQPFGDRGEFVGVFAVAKLKSGDYLTEVMTKEEVESIRDRSEMYKKYKTGTWVTDFNEMAKKSAIRRLFKTLPRTDERRMQRLAAAVDISNNNEGFEPILSAPRMGQYTAEQKEYFDQLIEKSDALGMYVFQQDMEESVFNNLYHSFEKGTKTGYMKLINGLLDKGRRQVEEMAADLEGLAQSNDDAGIQEVVSDLTDDQLKLVKSRLSNESAMIIDEINKAAA